MQPIDVNRMVSPRTLAEAIGMSESSLKRWADNGLLEVSRTAGGHRRITIREAIRFVRDRGITLLNPAAIGLPVVEVENQVDLEDLDQVLLEHISQGHVTQVWQMLMGRFLGGDSIASLGDGPIKSCLRELGSQWDHDADGIFVEHRATDLCIQIVQQMRLLSMAEVPKFRATGGAVDRDPYLLPSLFVASVITEAGGEATNLGPNTPLDVLRIDSTGRPPADRPDLVWVSVSVLDEPAELSRQISALAEECEEAGILLAIGGREANDLSLPHNPNLSVHGSLASFSALAESLVEAKRG